MYIISRKFQWIFPSVLTVTKLHVKHGWFEQFMWWKSTYWSSVHLINHAFLINKKCEKERSREREIENHLCFKWLSTHFFSLIGSLRIYLDANWWHLYFIRRVRDVLSIFCFIQQFLIFHHLMQAKHDGYWLSHPLPALPGI